MAKRGQLCQADPETCTPPPVSSVKDDDPSISGPGFLLLKPCLCHDVGDMELSTARNSTPLLYNHDSVVRALLL